MKYFFLASALPPLSLDERPEIDFQSFVELAKDNLTPFDYRLIQVIRRFYDIENLRLLWKEMAIEKYGNLDLQELKEALLTEVGLPDYILDFLKAYETTEKRLRYFSALMGAFFREEEKRAVGFLKKWLEFERRWRLVVTVLRAKRLKRDLVQEFQFEDQSDDFVAELLAGKDALEVQIPEEFHELKVLWETEREESVALHRAFILYRFQKAQEFVHGDSFSIDVILSYLVNLILIEKWQALNRETGLKQVERFTKEPIYA